MKNSSAVIDYLLLNFKHASELLPGSRPGFNHALKLSSSTIESQRIRVGTSSTIRQEGDWTYRYKLSPQVPKYSVGLLTALMDELSTDAVFRVGLPAAPGLSLQMQTELVDKKKAWDFFHDPTKPELDIINTVAKLGKTISHTRTDFRCPNSKDLIAFSSHVKYMPSGSFFMDVLFRNRILYDLYVSYSLRTTTIRTYDEKSLLSEVILPHLTYHHVIDADSDVDDTTPQATFQVNTEHTNPFGALHGGCHAMIMEVVAQSYAANRFQTTGNIVLEAMQVEYLSAGQQGPVDVYCETLGEYESSSVQTGTTLHVKVLIKQQTNGRVSSEGKLRFSVI